MVSNTNLAIFPVVQMTLDHNQLAMTLTEDGHGLFGGLAYGLEPLYIPTHHTVLSSLEGTRPTEIGPNPLAEKVTNEVVSELQIGDSETRDRLFWFRWITGHQTTFLLWQLLAAATAEAEAKSDNEDALRRARLYVRGYSQMLLYTGSCPREIYHRVIRAVIARQHPYLSGSWAQDYAAVRSVLRQKKLFDGDEGRALSEECLLNQKIHDCIAAKLVPSGESLLHASADRGRLRARQNMLATLYDGTFLTIRADVPYHLFSIQLLRRLSAIRLDIAVNSLYPGMASSSTEEEPAGLRDPVVMLCKQSIPQTLTWIEQAARTCK